MGLIIQSVKDKGDLENERLVLKAIGDLNTLGHVVMDTTIDEEGNVSNIGRHAYKFGNKEIEKGDLVVLYTREQQRSLTEIENKNKNTTHFFFWGRDSTVWNQEGDYCTIMYIVDSKAV